jgi:hypothetical protein
MALFRPHEIDETSYPAFFPPAGKGLVTVHLQPNHGAGLVQRRGSFALDPQPAPRFTGQKFDPALA